METERQQLDSLSALLDGEPSETARALAAAARRSNQARTPQASRSPAEEGKLEEVLRKLLNYLRAAQPQPARPATVERDDDVVDLELDGHRFTIIVTPPPNGDAPISLSPREQEIVRLVAKGLPNKAIALILDISPWTVAAHLRRVFAKLEVSSRAEMIAYVMANGLLAANSDGSQGR